MCDYCYNRIHSAYQNISTAPVLNTENIFLARLHINLGFIENFDKALNCEGPFFQYLIPWFPKLTYIKIKDRNFTEYLTHDKAETCTPW